MSQSSSHYSSNPGLNITHMSVSPSLATMPSFDKHGIDPAQASLNRLQQLMGILDSTLRLPNTARAFSVYLLGLTIVLIGAFLHVLVAAQIMQAEFTLSKLQEEHLAIEQQNGDIIFKIARDTNMARLHQRVTQMGYVPAQEREYIFVETSPSDNLASTTPPAPVVTANDAPANDPTQSAPSALSNTNVGGGQWARWEEFWSMTLRSATGNRAVPVSNPTVSKPQPTSANPNFWAVWWEQASDQGAKLLEQFNGQ